jgi:hypothetical protein
MRSIVHVSRILTVVSAVLISTSSAKATDLVKPRPPAGYAETQDVHHWRYVPSYRHVVHVADTSDPYAYRYQRRGYYPYYHSNYWVPASEMRYRYRYTFTGQKYKYSQSWGKTRNEHGLVQPQNEPGDIFHRKHW